jgi:transposase-like protein
MKKGPGSKFGRKKEAAIAALLSGKSQAEAARVAGVDPSTLKRWMRLPEFDDAYLKARRDVLSATNARLQQSAGAAAAVLLRLMVDPQTPASIRARTAQCVLECATKSLALEETAKRVQTEAAGNPPAGAPLQIETLVLLPWEDEE